MADPIIEDADEEGDLRSWHQRLGDTRNWDKVIIFIAAVLSCCFVAFMFKPSIAPSITKVFESATAMQEAEARRLAAPPPATPGEVNMMLFPTKPASPPKN